MAAYQWWRRCPETDAYGEPMPWMQWNKLHEQWYCHLCRTWAPQNHPAGGQHQRNKKWLLTPPEEVADAVTTPQEWVADAVTTPPGLGAAPPGGGAALHQDPQVPPPPAPPMRRGNLEHKPNVMDEKVDHLAQRLQLLETNFMNAIDALSRMVDAVNEKIGSLGGGSSGMGGGCTMDDEWTKTWASPAPSTTPP